MFRSEAVTLAELSGPDAPAVLAALRSQNPVTWVPVLDGWLVTGHAAATSVLRDPGAYTVDHPGFSTAQVVGPSMLSLDGSEHLRHRRPFGSAFRATQIGDRFGPLARTLARDLVDAVRPAGRADLRAQLAGPLSVAVVAGALGLHAADPATVLRWYTAIVGAVTDITSGLAPRPAAAAAMAELGDAVRSARRAGAGTLLSSAAPALDDAEITSNAAVLMFGGIDTTEGMIVNALVPLLADRSLAAAVRADDALLDAAIEESLRVEPAASVVDRYATGDVELGSAKIRRGDLVRVSLTAANRDPDVFAEPDRFDPRRTNLDPQLAFARGPHTCLAMDLARLETRTAVRAVLERLPGVRLAQPAAAVGLVFRKPAALPVEWDLTSSPD